MSTFQTTCPSCQRLLELPREAIGRSARCPACQHTFTASGNQAAETQAHETPAPGDLALNGPTTSAPLPSIEPSPFVSGPDSPDAGFPRSGTENPYVNPISGGAAAMGGANPYQPSGHIPNTPRFSGTVAPGEMVVCTSTFDSVWATAFSIYKDRWGRLLGAMAIVMAISLGVFAVTGVLGAVLGGNNQGQHVQGHHNEEQRDIVADLGRQQCARDGGNDGMLHRYLRHDALDVDHDFSGLFEDDQPACE